MRQGPRPKGKAPVTIYPPPDPGGYAPLPPRSQYLVKLSHGDSSPRNLKLSQEEVTTLSGREGNFRYEVSASSGQRSGSGFDEEGVVTLDRTVSARMGTLVAMSQVHSKPSVQGGCNQQLLDRNVSEHEWAHWWVSLRYIAIIQ